MKNKTQDTSFFKVLSSWKNLKLAWLFSLLFLFFGGLAVSATFPPLPSGATSSWGWLGEIFNLTESSSGQLALNSKKIVLPEDYAPIVDNEQLTTKKYVDSRVEADGDSASEFPLVFDTVAYKNGGSPAYCLKFEKDTGVGEAVNNSAKCGNGKHCKGGFCIESFVESTRIFMNSVNQYCMENSEYEKAICLNRACQYPTEFDVRASYFSTMSNSWVDEQITDCYNVCVRPICY